MSYYITPYHPMSYYITLYHPMSYYITPYHPIQIALVNLFDFMLCCLRLVRVLGELYNYSVVSAPVIYELLYTVINYGHLKEEKPGAEVAVGSTGRTALSAGEAPFRYGKQFAEYCVRSAVVRAVCETATVLRSTLRSATD
jgi:hypothetical protein